MKKTVFVALAMLTAICGCKAGEQAENQTVKSTDKVVKETRQVDEFSGITLIGSCKVICTLDSTRSVVVEAPKEAAQQLLTEVMPDGVLNIRHKKIAGVSVIGAKEDRTTVYVTVPTLQSIKLIGSGDIIVKGKVISDDKLNVVLSGSGDIEFSKVDVKFANFSLAGSGDIAVGNIKSKQAKVSLAGSGDIKVDGIASDGAQIILAGSGDIAVGNVKAAMVTATATGSGDMKIGWVNCAVLDINQTTSSGNVTVGVKAVTTNVNMVGSGNLKLSGTTNVYNEVKHGSGKINKSGLKYDKTTQTKQNGWQSVSNSTTSPNGIEAEP